jgi:uncharacterized protein YidB (DUF937 family)
LQQLEQSGHAGEAQSWVSSGGNKTISPSAIEDAFGSDIIDTLSQQFGLPRQELLSGLAEALPETVDKLTPDGRMPTLDELSRWT